MRRERIEIPAPLFRKGQEVRVLNYRKQRETWEVGEVFREPIFVIDVERYAPEIGHWLYTVELVRTSAAGRTINLCVTDDRIRPAT